jgi:ClpP class serine protease
MIVAYYIRDTCGFSRKPQPQQVNIQRDCYTMSTTVDDIKQLENVKKITVRLNTIGGDAYAAIPIHNRLRELKAEITAIVDGVAFSGGSLIMCAADKVLVNPSSLMNN